MVLTAAVCAAVCAVAAGAQSFVAIAEWVADLPSEVATAVETTQWCPSGSTFRRLPGAVDADRFDVVISRFLQRCCARVAPVGRRRVLAIDGKTPARQPPPSPGG